MGGEDSTNVYYLDGYELTAVPLSGGTPVLLGYTSSITSNIAIGGGFAYWGSGPSASISKLWLGGGSAETLATTPPPGCVSSVALDPASVYWSVGSCAGIANQGTSGQIVTAPVGEGAGTPTTLASGRVGPVAIAIDETSVYWAETGCPADVTLPCEGAVLKVPKGGGVVTTLATMAPTVSAQVSALAIDETTVYWLADAVMSVPLAGGAATTLAMLPPNSTTGPGLAVDSTSLYWTWASHAPGGAGSVLQLTPK
jgi:hypothetical protein